jgi:HAD superfamily hydrolase (TIGR01549 family)
LPLECLIFDLDGTVVVNAYDWARIKAELGSGGAPILPYLEGLEEPERSRKREVLERYEAEQTAASRPRSGIREFLGVLGARSVRTALVTNNSSKNTAFLLERFGLAFDLVLTRESGLWKPSGAPFLEVMRVFGLGPKECCVVGDTRFDVLAAADAGIADVFILSDDPGRFSGSPVEVCPTLDLLRSRVEKLLPAQVRLAD